MTKDKVNETDLNQETTVQGSEAQTCENQKDKLQESYIRLVADFENYKRRVEKEKLGWVKMAQSNVFYDLLPVIDDFDRALKEKEADASMTVWLEGFKLIRKSLDKILDKYEIKYIDCSIPFNPELHEAVAQIDSANHKSGQIVEVYQSGYIMKDQVLRPAKVVVAK
ncbi:MAG: Protein GrpE [candidate division TM6 bacterium GW2011_GWF2_32_72]|nr:MAG: Protein GrpE [candidate division TM6 bacterium GW2011_GWF2_32_72]